MTYYSSNCPVCGRHEASYEIVEIWTPHSELYASEIWGKTYRQLGIPGKGRWIVRRCSIWPGDEYHVWATLTEKYD